MTSPRGKYLVFSVDRFAFSIEMFALLPVIPTLSFIIAPSWKLILSSLIRSLFYFCSSASLTFATATLGRFDFSFLSILHAAFFLHHYHRVATLFLYLCVLFQSPFLFYKLSVALASRSIVIFRQHGNRSIPQQLS